MEKKVNKYHLTLKLLQDAGALIEPGKELMLEFDNHDEIFSIIERIKAKAIFENNDHSTEFAIGLNMFSEVMLKNRNLPLFEELRPAFQSFMKRLKSA